MQATESVLRAGYRLDRYELLCPIASGGMATVWLARLRGKRGFEKLFAVKTIRTDLVDDARFQEMFLDEARIASGIQHPNVAQILDLGEQDEVLFIVMEWVDGDSLAKVRKLLSKREATLPVGIVLRVLADACAGLHAAHELRDDRGEPLEIVHRDVSPHNILVAASGAVKVIDFGIAKAQNRRQGQTRTGIVKGKIQYMAPEQVNKGGAVDRRADVWALGMCLHELVAGRLPYDGDDDVEVIRKLMARQAPAIAPGLPAPVVRALERSIAFEPDARFPTAAAMQRALEGAMKELGTTASSEDVAAFLRSELAELAARRREAIGRAVEEARERSASARESGDEVAFAPTVVGARAAAAPAGGGRPAPAADEARAIALTKRKPASRESAREDAVEDARTTSSAALDQEPIAIPKRSRAWVWGAAATILGAGVAAATAWPFGGSRRPAPFTGAATAASTGASTGLAAHTTPRVAASSPSPAPAASSMPAAADTAARPIATEASVAPAPEAASPSAHRTVEAPSVERLPSESPPARVATDREPAPVAAGPDTASALPEPPTPPAASSVPSPPDDNPYDDPTSP